MSDSERKFVVIIFGPPGAGKGTQGTLVSEKYGLYYFETSKILESYVMHARKDDVVEVEGVTYNLFDEKRKWETGILLSPPFVLFLVRKKIQELYQQGRGLLLSGSPRTVFEAERLAPMLKELYGKDNVKIVHLSIRPAESIRRNSHRRICELMRHPILWNDETKNLTQCPLDGSDLVRREGLDDPETIKARLKEYEERTLPMTEVFKKEGLEVREVDGEKSPAEVFESIIKALENERRNN